MKQYFANVWNDDEGSLIAIEWLFLVTIAIIGLVTGFLAVQAAVVDELVETANGVASLSQAFAYTGSTYNAGGASAGQAEAAFNGAIYSDVDVSGVNYNTLNDIDGAADNVALEDVAVESISAHAQYLP